MRALRETVDVEEEAEAGKHSPELEAARIDIAQLFNWFYAKFDPESPQNRQAAAEQRSNGGFSRIRRR